PSVENGHSPELNHVSSTSGSCSMCFDPQWAQACGASRATVMPPQSAQCQAGMRWPHHSWREMHQSRMLYIHSKYVFDQLSGTKTMRPSSTALMAGPASGFIEQNHCVDTSGSTTVRQRWQWPTLSAKSSV